MQHTYTDFRFCSLRVESDESRSRGMIRDSMRHPGRAVDRHLDRDFDSTRQSFGFSFARITIYVYIYLFRFEYFFASKEEDISLF